MKKIKVILITLFAILFSISIDTTFSKTSYDISDYQMKIVFSKDGVGHVEEKITLANTKHPTFLRHIETRNTLTIDDENLQTKYHIDNVITNDLPYQSTKNDDFTDIVIDLNEDQKDIVLNYDIHTTDLSKDKQSYLYLNLLSSLQEDSIQNFSFHIEFPKPISSEMEIKIFDANHQELPVLFAITTSTTTIEGKSNGAISSDQNIYISGLLPDGYFIYTKPFNFQTFATVFICLLVIVVYSLIFYHAKTKERHSKNKIPLEVGKDIPILLHGYVMDHSIWEQDIVPQLVTWANDGYIEICNCNNIIKIVLLKELPDTAYEYEKYLFDSLFKNKTELLLSDLYSYQTKIELQHTKSLISKDLMQILPQNIYFVTSWWIQLLNAIIVGLPVAIFGLAVFYTEDNNLAYALLNALLLEGVIFLTCLPWIFVIRHQRYHEQIKVDMHRVLATLLTVIIISMLGRFLMNHGAYFIQLVVVCIASICCAFSLLFLHRRTNYGKEQLYSLAELKYFIKFAKKPQLQAALKLDPEYFIHTLPNVYIFGTVEDYFKKFKAIDTHQPTWFDTDQKDNWMTSLHDTLYKIYDAFTNLKYKK